jgi:hypothetical protein
MADNSETLSNRLAIEFADGTADLARPASLPGVPPPSEDLASVARTVRALKTVIDTMTGTSGSVLDKALTSRDLLNDNVLVYTPAYGLRGGDTTINMIEGGATPGGYEDPRPVLSTPPSPENLQVLGAFNNVLLSWELFDYRNHAYTEILRYTSDNVSLATVIGTAVGNQYTDATAALGATYYYWIRAVNLESTTGTVNATAGTSGGRLRVGNVDLADQAVTANNIASGAVTPIKMESGTAPVFIGASLPALPNSAYPAGTLFITTSNNKLYRSTGTLWISQVDGADIVSRTVSSASLIAGTITAGSGVIAVGAITTAMIQDLAVDNAKIAVGSIGTANIIDGTITNAKITNGTITDAKIVSVAAGKIVTGTIAVDTNITLQGQINGGDFTEYAWPSAGANGFHLSDSGLLLGDYYGQTDSTSYFQVNSAGSLFTRSLQLVNNVCTVEGEVRAGRTYLTTGSGVFFGRDPLGSAYVFSVGKAGDEIVFDGLHMNFKFGQTAFRTGVGMWVDWTAPAYRISIGNGTTSGLSFDGGTLALHGELVGTSNIVNEAISVSRFSSATSSFAVTTTESVCLTSGAVPTATASAYVLTTVSIAVTATPATDENITVRVKREGTTIFTFVAPGYNGGCIAFSCRDFPGAVGAFVYTVTVQASSGSGSIATRSILQLAGYK